MNEPLSAAIVGHLIGDYLLQNDWMAHGKKRSSLICVTHCFIWSVAVMACAKWYGNYDGFKWIIVWLVLFMAHFLQDRTDIVRYWMTEINSQRKFIQPPMAPWSLIVVDNVWHIVTIYFVWRFLT